MFLLLSHWEPPPMCNEYQQRVKRGLNDDAFPQIKVPLTWTDPEPNESGTHTTCLGRQVRSVKS
ncbi:hypothetical protein [Phenylobacterium sp.]|uniref:hypothetical protein n=1 Tax=Phenylobacterium sp. TaxID=1871053 RepID=UPI00286E0DD4|nr:hypothetical protein [Phenylobacterium sp.]